MKIGIFDSGVGGLSIFKALKKELPDLDYLYFADSARSPYGNHSHEVIYGFVLQAVKYLFRNDCKIVILACNTASAQALRQIQREWLPKNYPDRRVLGIIFPIAEAVSRYSDSRIGVIGTRATINSHVYLKEIEKNSGKPVKVIEKACPLLVPLIEEGFANKPETKKILRYYLRPLKQSQIKVLINGCSHYQLLHDQIQAIMGKNVLVLDTADIVAMSLREYLSRHPEIFNQISRGKTTRFVSTDLHGRFNQLATLFFGQPIKAEKVDLAHPGV